MGSSCTRCAAPLPADVEYCSWCGAPTREVPDTRLGGATGHSNRSIALAAVAVVAVVFVLAVATVWATLR